MTDKNPTTLGRWILLCVLAVSLSLSSTLAVGADMKIGVVNLARAIDSAPQREDAEGTLEREFGSRERDLLSQQRSLGGLEEQLTRDGAVMTEQQRANMEKDITKQRREVRRALEEFREDLRVRRVELMGELQRTILQVIREIGKKEKYDLIISNDVIFAGDHLDMTELVIKRLREVHN
jgi:outer membrane protein